MDDSDDTGGTPPCFADEMVGGYAIDAATRRDLDRFRRAERSRLYDLRRGMTSVDRTAQTNRVYAGLDALLPNASGLVIAAYWPIRGELDLRPWMKAMSARGANLALPVVVQRGAPVSFHRWTPGCRMMRGDWSIPVPADPQAVRPDVVIVPLLGVDEAQFRLGNGGGYYDMTLAASDPLPHTIAVGQDFCRIPTIFPQGWDIRMQTVLLGDGSCRT
ncbi:5-formyltetrahydrofolate cyclo-ligase [Puniceibacterium sp. IMCC21224]|uniref:5-formyltetrahydrofolate cyclo-ligase n=1 Tax=Puniceibacterium sp. IMCC21224 TaxID=1618204 RepID=UPI00064DBC2E|nr:5-formyltetrahydrofolate cyclo-ligase [Puniceibacterium sp. IMCC21224]KMK68695.1 5,10-methenyltetrahydrofolate synthetase [Puniceibacterium sp. IMCC21224]